MRNYEARKPSYFATPSPQLIYALNTSLKQITVNLPERFAQHYKVSRYVKDSLEALGLKQLAAEKEAQANGMTAVYLPEGITLPDLLPKLAARDVIFAGGVHKEIATKYFRFGHMGVSALNSELGHVEKALKALRESLAACRK